MIAKTHNGTDIGGNDEDETGSNGGIHNDPHHCNHGGPSEGPDEGQGGVKRDQEAEQGDTHEVTRDHGPRGQAQDQGRRELQQDQQG